MKFKIGDIVNWSQALWAPGQTRFNFRISGIRGKPTPGALRIYEVVPIGVEDYRYNYYDAQEEELFLVQEPNEIFKKIL